MNYHFTESGLDAVREKRYSIRFGESVQQRMVRLHSEKLFLAFKREAEYALADSTLACDLLYDCAMALCYHYHIQNLPFESQPQIPPRFESVFRQLREKLTHRGTAVNMAAICYLSLFHPLAIDYYFGRA